MTGQKKLKTHTSIDTKMNFSFSYNNCISGSSLQFFIFTCNMVTNWDIKI